MAYYNTEYLLDQEGFDRKLHNIKIVTTDQQCEQYKKYIY